MADNLSWSSGSGFSIAALQSGIGGGESAYFQRVIVQTGLVNVQGQVTAVGTLTAQVQNVVTAEARGFVTAQLTGGWPVGVTGQVTAHGTITAEAKGTITAEVKGTVTAEVKGTLTAQVGTVTAVPSGGWPTRPPIANVLTTALPALSGIDTVTAFTAQGAGSGILMTKLVMTNSHGTTGALVSIRNGATPIEQAWCAPSGGGAVLSYGGNPLPISANSACVVTTDASANVYVSLLGYKDAL